MGKYLFTLAILGVCIYLYMAPSKSMQVATEYEIAELHNPLIPIPASVREMREKSDADMQAGAKTILVHPPQQETGSSGPPADKRAHTRNGIILL